MARRILVLSALATVVCAYFIFFRDRDDLIWMFAISIVLAMLAYTFQHQIDHLMIRGVPQKLPPAMRSMLLQTAPQFQQLPSMQQLMAEDRIHRWVMKMDFIDKHEHEAPQDLRYILAWYAILLTLHQEKYLYEGLDRVAFYEHPFLSPAYPDQVHIAEVETKDGTLIISIMHAIKGHMEKGYYNIALHLMAEAYAACYLKKKISWPEDIWEQLEEISTMPKERIEAYLGLPLTNPWPVAVHHQLMYKDTNIPEVLSVFPHFQNVIRSF